MSTLTDREEKFCQNYVRHGVAYKAALEAGYTEAVANAKSCKMLRRPHVAKRIAELRDKVDRMAVRSSVDVINELSRLAFSDTISFMKPDPDVEGNWIFKSPDELTADQRAAVSGVHVDEVQIGRDADDKPIMAQRYSYTFHDKLSALVQMGRHYGLFDDRLRVVSKSSQNRFSNLSTEQLNELRSKIVKFIVSNQSSKLPLEGQYIAKAKTGLPDD